MLQDIEKKAGNAGFHIDMTQSALQPGEDAALGEDHVAGLGGQVKELTAKLVTASLAPEIRYVAVLADDKAAASVLVTFDPKNQKLVLKRVGGFQEQADKSLELWALPQTGSPKSLGVMGGDAVMRLTAAGNDVKDVPMLAITLEPKGGAPAMGGPTGPVLFKGALIETAL